MNVISGILRRLVLADVRFVVVGGIAVVLHGHLRATKDLHLAIDLAPEQARKAIDALTNAGLRPALPVDATGFADAAIRETWVRERNMVVFQMVDPTDARRSVDLFAEPPIDFEELWARAVLVVVDDVTVRVASIPDLVTWPWPDARDDLAEVLRTTTPAQRLAWVEEMLDLAHASGGLEKARRIELEERRAAFARVRHAS